MTPTEKTIATALVKKAIELGWTVSVYDGEEWCLKRSREWEKIIEAMGSTDSDGLRFRLPDGTRIGQAALIYGNGRDQIADYSDNANMIALVKAAENEAGAA